MPIFLRHDTILKETYGEYFLAELIEAQDEENHAVVCEVGDLSAWVTLSKRNERNKHILPHTPTAAIPSLLPRPGSLLSCDITLLPSVT